MKAKHLKAGRSGRRLSCAWIPGVAGVAGVAAAVLGLAASASAQCNYELVAGPDGQPAVIIAPDCPLGGPPVTRGTGLNSQGWVCGRFEACFAGDDDWGFWWTPETGFHIMPKPQGVLYVRPLDINDAGFIVGTSWLTGIGNRGFIFDIKTQEYTYLEPLNGVGDSWANAVNNGNVVAGARSIGPSGVNPYNAVIWRPLEPGAPVQDLGDGNPNSSAFGVNDDSDAVGWTGTAFHTNSARAHAWINGMSFSLGVPKGAIQSWADSINANRVVVGSGKSIAGPLMGFRWEKGVMMPLLPPKNFDQFLPANITDAQQIVGNLVVDSITRPGLWQHGNFYDLTELTETSNGLMLQVGRQISNDGRILCRAQLNGKVVAVLLKPIDQPPTDLNHDCRTDERDLLILLEGWGPVPRGAAANTGLPSADFNEDGRVDVLDLLILLSNWGGGA